MNNGIGIILVPVLLTALASCARQYYLPLHPDPSSSGSFSSVSFSSEATRLPEVSIIINGNSLALDKSIIDDGQNKIYIPSNIEATLEYSDFWISTENVSITGGGARISGDTFRLSPGTPLQPEKNKEIRTCFNSVVFTPESNKHYEVSIKLIDEKCLIDIKE